MPTSMHEQELERLVAERTRDLVAANAAAEQALSESEARFRALSERGALEARLVQAERLEAIGQLAGGVAHDFNNILLVIRGYSSVLRGSLGNPQPAHDVEEVLKAAGR